MTSGRKERDRKLGRTAQLVAARRSVALAGHSGDADRARDGLGHDDPTIRATALRALSRIGLTAEAEVRRAASDPDPQVRGAAADATVDLEPDRARALLGRLLEDPEAAVAESASFAAGELGTGATELVPAVAALMDHEDAVVRETAVAALGAIGAPAALPTILAATGDRATVRRRAVIALAAFDGPAVDRALSAALEDRDWQVRQAAEDQLAMIEDEQEGPP